MIPALKKRLSGWLGISQQNTLTEGYVGLRSATVTFDYDTIVIWDNDMWGFQMGGEHIAFIRHDQLVNERRIELRNKAREVVLRQPVRDLSTFRFTPDLTKIVIRDADKNLLIVQPIDDISTWQFEDAPLIIEEPEPEPPPEPPPLPPVDIDEYRVVWSFGVNVREEPDVSSTDVGDIAAGTIIECDHFSVGDYPDNPYEWLRIASGPFSGKWTVKTKFGPGGPEHDKLVTYLVLEDDYTEPVPSSPTVQLTGPMQLETRPDGWTVLTNNENRNGVNMRYATKGNYNVDKHLQYLAAHGIKWVRVYFAQEGKSLQQCLADLKVVLDKCAALGLYVIVVITDSIRLSGMTITEDAAWHTESSLKHLSIRWYEEKRHRGPYMAYAKAVASTFKDHPALKGVDMMNEPGAYIPGGGAVTQAHTNAIQFAFDEISRAVYQESDGKLFSTIGFVNVRHVCPAGKDQVQHALDFYRGLPYVHIVTGHVYSVEGYAPDAIFDGEKELIAQDWPAAKALGKAVWIGEAGTWHTNGNRPGAVLNLKSRHEAFASGISYWTFELELTPEGDAFAWSLPRDGQGTFDAGMAAVAA